MIGEATGKRQAPPKKRLYFVTRSNEALVWAESAEDAESLARSAMRGHDDYITVEEADPEFHLDEIPVGTSVRVRCLLTAGDGADSEDLREAWLVSLAGAPWLTDGYAAFPEGLAGIPGFWVAFQDGREQTDMVKFASALKDIVAGRIPKVTLGALTGDSDNEPVYPIGDEYSLAARYVDAVLAAWPMARWYHHGDAQAAFARAGARLVAIIMPVRGRFGAASAT